MIPETYSILFSSLFFQRFLSTWDMETRSKSFIYFGYSFAHLGWRRLLDQVYDYEFT